jgi:hypothetical protein
MPNRAKTILVNLFLLCAPVPISIVSVYIVAALTHVEFIYLDPSGFVARVTGVLVDLLLQSVYFSIVITLTKQPRFFFALLIYQIFTVVMFLRLAHDPAKWNRFADKIMRQINKLARDRTQNRYPLLLIAR